MCSLHTAAPDLLEVLKALHPRPGVWCTPTDAQMERFEAALAKAEGE
jgi:hypothetical protein